MRKLRLFILPIFASAFIICSCKKNVSEEKYTPIVNPVIPDLTTRVNAAVNGFITDENGNAVEGASIKAGSVTITTDQFGYFKINAAAFAKSAGFVQVSKAGYFTGYRTFLPAEDKETFIRLQLIPKTTAGIVDAVAGGTVSTAGGATVTLPADAVMVASNNAAYTGTVNIAAHWLNPAEEEKTNLLMPGNLTGIDSSGYLNILVTYGMLAVELTGSNGELLQVAAGKKASLHFPIPASLQGSAPATIPLWYFDEENGLWKQEGRAVKNGTGYDGEVRHFSFWNCDMGLPLVNFTAQIIDTALNPVSNTLVGISINGQPGSARFGYTNSDGIIYGLIPANTNMSMSLVQECTSITINTFASLNSDIDLGTITAPANPFFVTLTGHVNRCNGTPVTNGSVIISTNNSYQVTPTNSSGAFSYTGILCTNVNAYVKAIDWDSSVVSLPVFFTTTSGNNDVGTITACTPSVNQSLIYSFDGNTTTFTTPQYFFESGYNILDDMTTIRVTDLLTNDQVFRLDLKSVVSTGQQNINPGSVVQIIPSGFWVFNAPSSVTVSQYGLIGQFIRGSVNGQLQREGNTGPIHTFDCIFNVQRTL